MSAQIGRVTFRSASDLDQALGDRIRSEYEEMPGMRLTLSQAARLFDLEAARCALILGNLVKDGALSSTEGTFVLASAGRRRV